MADQSTQRYTGTVKFYNRLKRYGFVIPDGKSDEMAVFFHSTDAYKPGFLMPTTGEVFSYTIALHDGREKAANIERPNAPVYVPRPKSEKPLSDNTNKPKSDKPASSRPRRSFRKTVRSTNISTEATA